MDALTTPSLLGRDDEIRCLSGMLAAGLEGRGGALVLRGEAGIGKSTVLDHVRSSAAGFRVVEASGSEFETSLPFAALHQLCLPLLDSSSGHHREALDVAFGLAIGKPDVVRVGMAVLDLVSRSGPVLCLVDDAHWLDEASAGVFAFLGRRLAAEAVVLVFSARSGPSKLDALPGLELRGLADADARTLLSSAVVDDKVRERLLSEARGNPLALLELPKAGGFAMPDVASVPSLVERSFQDRAASLPADARLLLTVASADPTGEPGLLWAAAARLGIEVASAGVEAEGSGLVGISTRVRFCHPLARSAVYLAASPTERQAAHLALAAVTDARTDPDRQVWHRAQAGTGPDDALAADLERSADRARARGGVAAAAAFLERAAALSVSPSLRAARTVAAAEAKLDAGAVDDAAELLTSFPADDPRADLVRGRIAFVRSESNDGPSFVLRAARRVSGAEARDRVLDAFELALAFGRPSGVMDAVVREARALERGSDALEALVLLADEGHAAAVPLLRRVFASDDRAWTRHPALATMLAGELWDTEVHSAVTDWLMKTGQQAGSPFVLRLGLAQVATGAVLRGEFGAAVSAIAEEEAVADAVGMAPLRYPRLHLAAFRGQKDAVLAESEHSSRRAGVLVANTHWASAVLHNGLGDYPAALAAARAAVEPGDLYLAGIALPELVEAAMRCGETELASRALDDLVARTSPCATSWAAGVASCASALVTGSEECFVAAVEQLSASAARPHLGRAHLLYGEWLRRAGRRVDARVQLRSAHELFAAVGMEAFAGRAALELRATGEVARSRSADVAESLTMQETHIARLVAGGATSKEVAARLFLSPRTVDAHLRNIYRKVGINSRRQLAGLF
ncbi:LuxR family transcriptional regulator [Lentzea sp. NBRC 102530]|uniref:AAA family ATPase n=1 Tax=Lentzea sp. NBRC 102530 TaxID=3032201 RepID=UPI0024A0FB93|nr:LuxR family transcriptional regulator [Lentzea sp. NBRC 102530]GLY47232.1 LuxR family transcriptional regulator [Lentzea sp. NBRC 102530]